MSAELTEFETRLFELAYEYYEDVHAVESFIQDLRKIMPPTCTPNERKFLDEIKEKSKYIKGHINEWVEIGYNSSFNQDDFEVHLKELVKKKQ
jgi:hypothetical protein